MTSALHRAWLPDQAAQATTRRIDMPTLPLHSYRAITWPAHIEAGDVEEHDAMGALPAWRIKAPSAEFAARGVAHISGQRVLRVERIDPPAPQSGRAQAATEIEAREVWA